MFTIHHPFTALAALCLLAPFAAGSGVPGSAESDESALQRGIEAHDRGVEGSERAVDDAIAILESVLEKDSKNPLARAYLGSAYTLKAREAALWRKPAWVERGVKVLDSAVEANPENPRVRLIRAINAYNLPRRAGRYDLASEDFAILLNALNGDAAMDDGMKRAVYFHAGAFALKERQDERALALLEKAAAVEGESELEDQLASLLRLARNRNR